MIPDLNTCQWLVRAIGTYLDEEPSCRISLAEVSDGFLVRLQRTLHKLEPQVEHFKRETLLEQLESLRGSWQATRFLVLRIQRLPTYNQTERGEYRWKVTRPAML